MDKIFGSGALIHSKTSLECEPCNFITCAYIKALQQHDTNSKLEKHDVLYVTLNHTDLTLLTRKLDLSNKTTFNILDASQIIAYLNPSALFDKISSLFTANSCIILDSLSILLDLGFAVEVVIAFVCKCHELVCSNPNAYLIIATFADAALLKNPIHEYLDRWLAHNANVIVNVQSLSTGRSQGVDGEITFWQGLQVPAMVKLPKTSLQYKVTDNAISFFAKGFSNDVI